MSAARPVTVEEAVAVLNRINVSDPTVLADFIAHYVPVSEALADDPTVQVGQPPGRTGYHVGLLGILNGIFGVRDDGRGWITAMVNADRSIASFSVTE